MVKKRLALGQVYTPLRIKSVEKNPVKKRTTGATTNRTNRPNTGRGKDGERSGSSNYQDLIAEVMGIL